MDPDGTCRRWEYFFNPIVDIVLVGTAPPLDCCEMFDGEDDDGVGG